MFASPSNWDDAVLKLKKAKVDAIIYKNGTRTVVLSCGHTFKWVNKRIFPDIGELIVCRQCNNPTLRNNEPEG